MGPWHYLPNPWRQAVLDLPRDRFATLEEIRFRLNRPVYLYGTGWQAPLSEKVVSAEDMERIVAVLAEYSLYARADELSRGYLTLAGGHRVGIAGRAVVVRGHVESVRQISGLNVRVARAVMGPGQALWERIEAEGLPLGGVLLISPPRAGKTTLLRDLIRVLSDQGRRIVVVDERSEISGFGGTGGSGHDLGMHTDVLDGWPKKEGIEVALRTLGPELIAVDELGDGGDLQAVFKARYSGVGMLATVHARSRADLVARREYRECLESGVFDAVVTLAAQPAPGTVTEVWTYGGRR
ncbi:ATPase, T2SS/T4P/T4SS family [Sulfobacillus harzensis]|uniref:Stage III sporulation protein AA n=1 Tax=Sulfobacillus harzensis TaxID=2729629 RepID=A0A7Y0L0S1_9FIRM|nr:ATPase, T2SS/T4P/T4SS family [Sulfobacillus harzensis]NMP21162.1 stage III sporulation protein AA [Sulfobacillus harzensis]